MKIISGGQTGVDRAALDAALSLGVPTGGWCPEGRLDECGIIPPHYPLQELPGGGYLERTAQNVSDADGTVIFHPGSLQGGTKATADFCTEKRKPCLSIDATTVSPATAAEQLREFVQTNRIEVLNVAGPRASQWPQGYAFTIETLTRFLCANAGGAETRNCRSSSPHITKSTNCRKLCAPSAAPPTPHKEAYELIVVDDASTDATAKIARQFGARVVPVNRRQIAAVRNAGARVARGEILFFVDADTRINPVHVAAGLEALADGYSGGSARLAVDSHLPFWARLFIRSFCTVYFAAGLGVGAFLFMRRESFDAVGGFDEQYFAGEEVYLTLALKKLGRFKILREPIITSARKVRMHSPRFVLAQSLFIIFGGNRSLRNREKLALWYDGKRERGAA